MKRILLMELRDAKAMVVVFLAFVAATWLALGLILKGPDGGFSSEMSGMLASMFLAYIPLLSLQVKDRRNGLETRFPTIASLPIGRVRLALSRYFVPVCFQMATGVLVMLSIALDSGRAAGTLGLFASATNAAFFGLGLMALALLAIDHFPKKGAAVASYMLIAIIMVPKAKAFVWLVDPWSSTSLSVPTAAIALAMIAAEVAFFSCRARLV